MPRPEYVGELLTRDTKIVQTISAICSRAVYDTVAGRFRVNRTLHCRLAPGRDGAM